MIAQMKDGPSTSQAAMDDHPISMEFYSGTSEPIDTDETMDFIPSVVDESPKEIVEMPFQRVMSTERKCFVCGSSEGRRRVTPQLGKRVFGRRRLFVTPNNRCCDAHLIKVRLFDDKLRR